MAQTAPQHRHLAGDQAGVVEELLAAGRGRHLLQRLDEAAKRALDIALAGLGLLLLTPVLLAIAAAIRLSSPGPALFRQVRVGHRQSAFVMLKFRTMYKDNDDASHRAYVTAMLAGATAVADGAGIYKLTHDPRVTRLGRLLRKTSLDELPQLVNVLRGDMSLVGPRPVLPWEAELFEHRHLPRFTVRPGITGLWQVSGRNALTMQEALDLDLEYARHRNLALDLTTLVRTIPTVLTARGAG